MLGLKSRVGLLGLLALLLIGSYAAASAEANQGPFWYHRNSEAEGNGVKLSAAAPEEIRGGGGEATLEGKIGGTLIEIASTQTQVKGVIYNNGLQGQAKLQIAYNQPTVVKPAGTHCIAVVGMANVIKVYGHQAWSYNSVLSELKEQPVVNQKPLWVFTGQELQQGATSLPTNVPFGSIVLKSSGGTCLLSSAQGPLEGSVAAVITPEKLGTFSKIQKVETAPNGTKLHFWNGKENIAAESGLTFNKEASSLKQTTEASTFGRQGGAAQEVALLEN